MPRPHLDTRLQRLVSRLVSLSEPTVLATIASTASSVHPIPGDRMLIEAPGQITGGDRTGDPCKMARLAGTCDNLP